MHAHGSTDARGERVACTSSSGGTAASAAYLAHVLETRGPHGRGHRPQPGRLRGVRRDIKGRKLTGEVFDRDTLIKAGIERADAFAAVHQRRQQQHRERARRARALQRARRRRAHLRPRRAAIYEQLRHPDRLERAVVELAAARDDPRARGCAATSRYGQGEVAHSSTSRRPTRSTGKRVLDIELPARALGRRGRARRHGAPARTDIDVVTQGDQLYLDRRPRSPRRAAQAPRAASRRPPMRIVIVGAGKSGLFLAQQLRALARGRRSSSRAPTASTMVAAMLPDVDVVRRRRVRARGARARRRRPAPTSSSR